MCGTPVASTSQTYNSYGSYDAVNAGPTPIDPYDSDYAYNPGGSSSTGSYGTTGSINYDTNEWSQSSSPKKKPVIGPYGTTTNSFPMPTGMLVWSIIMIFFSGALGLIATIFCVLAKFDTTREGYERKIKIARMLNIIGTAVVILMFFVAGSSGCVALLASDSDFMSYLEEFA